MKLIAVTSMIIDHLGVFLFPRFIPLNIYRIMRTVGRIAFPIYCFLIINGFRKTRDVKRYLTRLIAFTVISQVPFVMTFDANPFPQGGGLQVQAAYSWFLCAALIFTAGAAWFMTVRRDWSVIWPLLALAMAVLRVDYNGVRILSAELNVFYTLALGLSVVAVLDAALKPDRDIVRLLMQALGLFAAFFLIRDNADYRMLGVAFIVSLWLTGSNRLSQAVMVLMWSAVEYIAGKLPLSSGLPIAYFVSSILSLLPILLYNGKLGRPLKAAFYLIYPVHLAVLGALTVYYTLA